MMRNYLFVVIVKGYSRKVLHTAEVATLIEAWGSTINYCTGLYGEALVSIKFKGLYCG